MCVWWWARVSPRTLIHGRLRGCWGCSLGGAGAARRRLPHRPFLPQAELGAEEKGGEEGSEGAGKEGETLEKSVRKRKRKKRRKKLLPRGSSLPRSVRDGLFQLQVHLPVGRAVRLDLFFFLRALQFWQFLFCVWVGPEDPQFWFLSETTSGHFSESASCFVRQWIHVLVSISEVFGFRGRFLCISLLIVRCLSRLSNAGI